MNTMQIKRLAVAATFMVASATASASITTVIIGKYAGECVAYARSLVPSLPSGLWTIKDKKNIINSHVCKPGSIAIINVKGKYARYGHVAYVEKCDRVGLQQGLTIREANWKSGRITRRQSIKNGPIYLAEFEMGIVGYYRP